MPRNFKTRDTEINFYLKYLMSFQVSRAIFEDQPGEDPYKIAIDTCAKLIATFIRANNNGHIAQLYFTMALMADASGNQSTFEYLSLSKRYEIIRFQKDVPFFRLKIIASSESCKPCHSQDKKVFTYEEALKTMPLPHKNCTHINFDKPGFCRCAYGIETKTK